jgi:uncharacterized membrane protein
MTDTSREQKLYKVFIGSIIVKGLDACFECAIGIALIFVNPNAVTKLAVVLTQGELVEDPSSATANYILKIAHSYAISSHTFLIWYLLIHGVIKLFLVGGLLLDKKWSYPLAIVILSLFAIYQVIQYAYTPAIWLLLLTIFDVFIVALVYYEYTYGRKIRAVL